MSLENALQQLEQSELIEPLEAEDPVQGPAFQFRHALIQDSAYQSLLIRQRQQIHRRAAKAIERLQAGRLEENAAILAHHYEQGEEPGQAYFYYAMAGNAAFRLSAYSEALEHFDHALRLAENDSIETPGLQALFLNRGRALELTQRFTEALENYRRMTAWADVRDDQDLKLAALLALSVIQITSTPVQNPPEGERLAHEALALSERIGDRTAQARAYWVLLLQGWPRGWSPDVIAFGEKSLAIARELNLREQIALTLGDLALGYGSRGDLGRCLEALEETIALWREMHNPVMVANSLNTISMTYLLHGDIDKWEAAARDSYEISKPIGNLWSQLSGALQLGILDLERARFSDAVAWMQEGVALSKQGGLPFQEAICRAFLGLVYSWLGARELALDQAEKATPGIGIAPGDIQGWIQSVLALIYLESGHLEAAEQHLDQYLPKANPKNLATPAVMYARYANCRLLEARGDLSGSLAAWEQLQKTQDETGVRFLIPDVHFHMACLFAAAGQPANAGKHLARAAKTAQALGVRRLYWKILAKQAELAEIRGKSHEALERKGQAAAELHTILASIRQEDLREAFQTKEDVRDLLPGT